jgi:hypothetical protein
VFDATFTAADAYKVDRVAVERMVEHNADVNGWQITVTRTFANDPDAQTIDISVAYESVISAPLPVD